MSTVNKIKKTLFIFSILTVPSIMFSPHVYADADEVLCPGQEAVRTAVGCIPVNNTQTFTEFLLTWGLQLGGGIALLLIGVGGFQVMTASGNPQKVQAGKELITASVAGLLFVVLSAFILRFVGIDILGIPEF